MYNFHSTQQFGWFFFYSFHIFSAHIAFNGKMVRPILVTEHNSLEPVRLPTQPLFLEQLSWFRCPPSRQLHRKHYQDMRKFEPTKILTYVY